MPRYSGPLKTPRDTSRGVHLWAIWEALTCLIHELPDVPTERRVRLRTCRAALERAYPELNKDVAVMQQLAEEDGEEIQDDP